MKTRIITALVGIAVLTAVLLTFDTLVFNLVVTAITLIAVHEIYNALGFEKRDWPLYVAVVPFTLLVMMTNYRNVRWLVMPAAFLLVLFYAIYLVARNGVISYQKVGGLVMFSGIVDLLLLLVHLPQGSSPGSAVRPRCDLLHPSDPLFCLGRGYLRLFCRPGLWQT